jgi:2-haloacid dehalogenase
MEIASPRCDVPFKLPHLQGIELFFEGYEVKVDYRFENRLHFVRKSAEIYSNYRKGQAPMGEKFAVDPTPPKRYEAFILDADNTLFDFDRAEKAALREALMASGFQSYPQDVFARYHRINEELWKLFERGMIDQGKLRTERFRRLIDEFPGGDPTPPAKPASVGRLYIEALSEKGYLLAHVHEVLQGLSSEVPLLLLSNGIASVQRRRIDRSGIGVYFREILISTEVGLAKPDPGIFALAIEKLQCRKEEILCVGDSPSSDIRGGNDAGLDTCWYAPGDTCYPAEEPRPLHRINDLRQLLGFLPERERGDSFQSSRIRH